MKKVRLPFVNPIFLALEYKMERKKILGLPIGRKREVEYIRECNVNPDNDTPNDVIVGFGKVKRQFDKPFMDRLSFFAVCATCIPDQYFHDHIGDFSGFATHGHEFSNREKRLMFMSHAEYQEIQEGDDASTGVYKLAQNWLLLLRMCGL
jgi:hypothetical protein